MQIGFGNRIDTGWDRPEVRHMAAFRLILVHPVTGINFEGLTVYDKFAG